MKRAFAVLALALLCAGCFESDKSLYQGTKPLTPFHAGGATSRDKDGKAHDFALGLDRDGTYRLAEKGKGGAGTILVRFFAVSGLPAGMLLAETRSCGTGAKCDGGYVYELAKVQGKRVEWHDTDCSGAFSRLAGLSVQIGSCKFADRASLEKALRAVAGLPWKADGFYVVD